MRWRVCFAMGWSRQPPAGSAAQLLHEVDVLLLGVVLAGALELGPSLVLGGADEIEETGLGTTDVAFRALLVESVQAQQGLVVRTLRQQLDVLGGLLECSL